MRGLLCLIVCGTVVSTQAADLPERVQRVLSGHYIDEDSVSILVQAVDAPEPVLSHLAELPRNPASVMKIVTTWTALEVLGPAYRWNTEAYFLGDFDGNTLDGELALKGYGDPYLVLEEFWKLLRSLRRLGLDDIDGGLVIDDSYFKVIENAPGAFDGQPFRTYNVLPNALLVNFKAVHFQFFPDPLAGAVKITTDPILNNLQIRNSLRLVDGPCRGYQRGISFNPTDPAAIDRIVFDGQFSRRCRSYGFSRTVLQHDTYTLGLFETLWREIGGSFDGDVRMGIIPEQSEPALTWSSPPLSEVIRSINKNSNNVMTRQLLYTLSAEQFGPPGTRASGIEVVREFLAERDLHIDSLVLKNGAGLSRQETVSADLLVAILQAAYRSAYAPEFIASLSLGGLDGTTRGRFDGDSANGHLHVKTGRIDHVSAMAGYVHAANGQEYIVAIMLNAENAHRGPGQELEEAVIDWVQTLN